MELNFRVAFNELVDGSGKEVPGYRIRRVDVEETFFWFDVSLGDGFDLVFNVQKLYCLVNNRVSDWGNGTD